MKRTIAKSFSRSLTQALLRGLAVFAIFGAAVYTYASIAYPVNQPNPVSGVVGLYVGKTASTYGGNIGSYQSANNLCASVPAANSGAHVCSPMEIVNTYNHDAATASAATGTVWLNAGTPGNTQPAVNDCNGWKSNGLDYYGNVWSFDQDYSGILPCMVSLSVACCK
jgi:hypothetical protein